jgi:hypothetical protein
MPTWCHQGGVYYQARAHLQVPFTAGTHIPHGVPSTHDLLPQVTVDQLLEEEGHTVLHAGLQQLQDNTTGSHM